MENVINIKNISKATDKKRITISSKRQITIPQVFYNKLGFVNFAECYIEDDKLVIRPERHGGLDESFGEIVLEELIAKGLSGQELLSEYKIQMNKLGTALTAVKNEATQVAEDKGEYYTIDEVFGEGDSN